MKLVISSLDEVPEPVRSEYESKDGKFHLKLEGDYPPLQAANAKVVEFRDKNVALLKEVEELRPLKVKFEGIDPDEARANAEKIKNLGKKGVTNPDDLDTRLKAMVEDLVKPMREQVAQLTTEKTAAEQRANDLAFDSTITDQAKLAGAQPKALKFLSGLAKDAFEFKDGKVVAKTGRFSKEKPGDPLTVEEWLKDTAVEHSYAFEASKGGGAEGRKPGEPGTPRPLKPGQTILKNPTPQELGAAAADVKAGKVKIEYDTQPTT